MKKIYLSSIAIIIFLPIIKSQNVGINTTGAIPAATNLFEVLQTSTTANSVGIYSAHSGAISGTGYGIWIQKTGASTTNVAGYFSASGATNNYAIIVPNGSGKVGIGTNAPAASSILDIDASDKGILIPRVALTDITDFSPITGAATDGLMVYSTATPSGGSGKGFYYWSTTDSKWIQVYDKHSGSGGYSINMGHNASASDYADLQTRYLHQYNGMTSKGNASDARIYIHKEGTIKSCTAAFLCGTASSGENSTLYLSVNGGLPTTLFNTITLNTAGASEYYSTSSLNISVDAGDYINVYIACPTWFTDPANVYASVSLYIE